MKTGTGSRRRGFALVLVGLALGGALWASPATSHVASWTHNWVQHIRPKADVRYYTKANSNARYFTRAQADARYVAGGDVEGARVTAVQLDTPLVLDVAGNRLQGTCGGNGGTIEYRNQTGAAARVMGPGTSADVANNTTINFGSQTPVTPRVDIVQVVWGPALARVTTFTVSWTAAAAVCEFVAQGVTSR